MYTTNEQKFFRNPKFLLPVMGVCEQECMDSEEFSCMGFGAVRVIGMYTTNEQKFLRNPKFLFPLHSIEQKFLRNPKFLFPLRSIEQKFLRNPNSCSRLPLLQFLDMLQKSRLLSASNRHLPLPFAVEINDFLTAVYGGDVPKMHDVFVVWTHK